MKYARKLISKKSEGSTSLYYMSLYRLCRASFLPSERAHAARVNKFCNLSQFLIIQLRDVVDDDDDGGGGWIHCKRRQFSYTYNIRGGELRV